MSYEIIVDLISNEQNTVKYPQNSILLELSKWKQLVNKEKANTERVHLVWKFGVNIYKVQDKALR